MEVGGVGGGLEKMKAMKVHKGYVPTSKSHIERPMVWPHVP